MFDITFWETLVGNGQSAKYIIPNSQIDNNWIKPNSMIKTGILVNMVGYGDNDDNTIINNGTISVFARSRFNISDLQSIKTCSHMLIMMTICCLFKWYRDSKRKYKW